MAKIEIHIIGPATQRIITIHKNASTAAMATPLKKDEGDVIRV